MRLFNETKFAEEVMAGPRDSSEPRDAPTLFHDALFSARMVRARPSAAVRPIV
jgi:hypothetical protein